MMDTDSKISRSLRPAIEWLEDWGQRWNLWRIQDYVDGLVGSICDCGISESHGRALFYALVRCIARNYLRTADVEVRWRRAE